MSGVTQSIERLQDYANSGDRVKDIFYTRSKGLRVCSTTDIKKCFSDKKTAIARYLVNTVLQCRIMLELTDKSKPKVYESLNVKVSYSFREDMKYNVYNILIELDDKGLLCKTVYAYPNSYVPEKKVDTQRNMKKAQDDFHKGSGASLVGGTGAVRGAVVVGKAVATGGNAGKAAATAAFGGAKAVEGTKATVDAIRAGATITKAVTVGAEKASTVATAATTFKTASGAIDALSGASGQGIVGLALTGAGAGLTAAGTAVGGTAGTVLCGAGAVVGAPVTAAVVGTAATIYSFYKFGSFLHNAFTWKSKAYRFARDNNSCISYMVLKPGDADTGMKFPKGLYGYSSILVISEDNWREAIDTYSMYPLPTKELRYDDFIGLFSTSPTGWPADEEQLHKHMERLTKLIGMIK